VACVGERRDAAAAAAAEVGVEEPVLVLEPRDARDHVAAVPAASACFHTPAKRQLGRRTSGASQVSDARTLASTPLGVISTCTMHARS
jgi:hypothetical protein